MDPLVVTHTEVEWQEIIRRLRKGEFVTSTGRQRRDAVYLAAALQDALDESYAIVAPDGTVGTYTIDLLLALEHTHLDHWDAALSISQAGG